MEEFATFRIMDDVVKLLQADRLVAEVAENLKDLSNPDLPLPILLDAARTEIRNVANILKIILDPEAKASVSIPIVCKH